MTSDKDRGFPSPSSGQMPMPDAASRRQSKSSPGSSLRSGATSLCASARSGGIDHRERPITPLMAGIDDLDADRAVVQPLSPLPETHPRMPGAFPFVHQAQNAPVLMDQVVRTDLGLRIAKPRQRVFARLHPGIVQDQAVDSTPIRPRIDIG